MADSIEVHFKKKDKTPVRAVFKPGKVKAVLVLPDGPAEGAGLTKESFAKANKIKFDPKAPFPPEIKMKKMGSDAPENVNVFSEGPGVCYWVDDTLVCW